MKIIKEKHPLAIRWAHWINFPILTVMIWSGLLIYWANDVYSVTILGHTFFHFFPDSFYKKLNVPQRLSEGMAFHFLFMWFLRLMAFYMLRIQLFPVNGGNFCQTAIRLKRHGWWYCMTCT